jgi:hypothetical protein
LNIAKNGAGQGLASGNGNIGILSNLSSMGLDSQIEKSR